MRGAAVDRPGMLHADPAEIVRLYFRLHFDREFHLGSSRQDIVCRIGVGRGAQPLPRCFEGDAARCPETRRGDRLADGCYRAVVLFDEEEIDGVAIFRGAYQP